MPRTMRLVLTLSLIWLAVAGVLVACRPATPTPMATAAPTATAVAQPSQQPLYLAIVWHQHQPFYAVDPETGLVQAPWVRLHAAKDYVDMAAMLRDYPQVHVTFNLTPSLLRQLDDLAQGRKDLYRYYTEIPADQLDEDAKRFILTHFFDINPKIIARFPRYAQLRDLRGGAAPEQIDHALKTWSVQDFRDLQVLFNLAWTDPDFLAQPPLADLVAKGQGFTEDDKATVLAEHDRLVREVVPTHRALLESGQIAITMTPYAHPILPLLVDSNLAKQALPEAELPPRFAYGRDAVAQLQRGVALYEQTWGRPPTGMWPAEGAVAQEIVGAVYRAGLRWMLTDENILARSLGLERFVRAANGAPEEAARLYRPYIVREYEDQPVVIFFRDEQLSNLISFEYNAWEGEQAAQDFLARLHAIREALPDDGFPYLVTVILDGENAWEYYPNDGKDFLHALYRGLSTDPTLKTVTPDEYLALLGEDGLAQLEVIPQLWAGSWDGASFATWIGEPEENKAWDYLGRTRAVLEDYIRGRHKGEATQAQLDAAMEAMLAAEGSDWFWWYGADKDSGNDAAFDTQFRETLGQVFDALGLERPAFLRVPIIPPPDVTPSAEPTGLLSAITVDGTAAPGEWETAGALPLAEGLTLTYGFDAAHLYLRLDAAPVPLDLYLRASAATAPGTPFAADGQTVLGLEATHRLAFAGGRATLQAWDGNAWQPVDHPAFAAAWGEVLEAAIPLGALAPDLGAGDALRIRLVEPTLGPATGVGKLPVPDLGTITWLVSFTDPEGDDHGPGTYTYPTDGVFVAGVFDLVRFEVGDDGENWVFRAQVRGPVDNPWGSPTGLALQTLDIYLDLDGPATGQRMLRPARNAALTPDHAWDVALTIEGWNPGLYLPGEEQPAGVPIVVYTNPAQRTFTAKVPKSAIPGDPTQWAYAVALMSQDGYGPWGIRDVLPQAEQWRIGGGPADVNHTRILDYLWPADRTPTQEEMLSAYTPVTDPTAQLGPDDVAQVEMLTP